VQVRLAMRSVRTSRPVRIGHPTFRSALANALARDVGRGGWFVQKQGC
jgi:hypothetical protein